jgi:acetylornithine deacetylase/succinyl-diaminopimelate desuccinylase-like protein
MRLVPHQVSTKVDKIFEDHFKKIAPPSVKVSVVSLHGGQGYVSPIETVAYKAASMAVEESFGKAPIPTRSGGSIYLRQNGRINAAQLRDLLGTSRKYAISLLEHLDQRKITRRTGDDRELY